MRVQIAGPRSGGSVRRTVLLTGFNRTDGSLEATNVTGTKHVTAFAAAAKAALYHVSTAFADTTAGGDRGRTAIGYAASKSAAEEIEAREQGARQPGTARWPASGT